MTTTFLDPSVQPGTPDPEFGEDGTVTLYDLIEDPEFTATRLFTGMASDSQGRSIFSAHMYRKNLFVYVLGRMDEHGRLDATFANRGLIVGNFVATRSSAGGKLAIQQSENGKIYLLGWSEREDDWADLAVACFDHKGNPDLTFGQGGRVIITTPPGLELKTELSSLYLQPDNKLLISPGYLSLTSKPVAGVLLRLLPDGSPDSEFSDNGRWEFKLPDLPNAATAIGTCLFQGQKIVIAGHAQFRNQENDAVLLRLNQDGQIDSGFGGPARPGFHIVQVPDHTTQFNALIERSDGSLIGAGTASMTGEQKSSGLLAALTPNGTPHQLFNNGDPLISRFDEEHSIGWASALTQTDNKFVVASRGHSVYLASFLPDGQPNTDFNEKGFIDLGTASITDPVVVTSSGRDGIIVSANAYSIGPEGVGLARRFFK